MDSFPFGRKGRKTAMLRAAGRRRARLAAPAGSPDAVLTDTDAAHAAQAAMQDRSMPGAPAWERFASVPLQPPRRQADGDAVLRLGQARQAAWQSMAGSPVPQPAHVRDYGTGPAYDLPAMGRHRS